MPNDREPRLDDASAVAAPSQVFSTIYR